MCFDIVIFPLTRQIIAGLDLRSGPMPKASESWPMGAGAHWAMGHWPVGHTFTELLGLDAPFKFGKVHKCTFHAPGAKACPGIP